MHNTLPDLEAQTQPQPPASKVPAGRSGTGHYGGATAQGGSSTTPGASSRSLSRKGTMPPPPPVTASATQSLFSSLIQPPAKRPRTIHNPDDPPPSPSHRARPTTPPRKTQPRTPRSAPAGQSKMKTRAKDAKGKRRETASSHRAIVTPQSTLGSDSFVDNDDDMKAAATLTSLLHSRPSMSVTASSPRSSLSAGSDGGSAHSYSQYAQSSTRTTVPSSNENDFPRAKTPPPSLRHARTQSLPFVGNVPPNGATTPKGRNRLATTPHPPSDTEAADLMLYLATSPSPVRPTSTKDKDAKDTAIVRTLSGSNSIKGRVLFPGSDERGSSGRLQRKDSGYGGSTMTIVPDSATDTGSGSSLASTSSPLNPNRHPRFNDNRHSSIPAPPTIIPPSPEDTRLLPAPTTPRTRSKELSGSPRDIPERAASVPVSSEPRPGATPGGGSFNLHEFINVSPSPSGSSSTSRLTSLRANVGRKLFEEHHSGTGRDNMSGSSHGGGLSAGIDLVKSSV